MHAREDMERYLQTDSVARYAAAPEIVYLAILKALRGDTGGACRELGRFWRTFGGWKEDVERLMAEYGCERPT
jgi:hypothetical protein